MATVQWTGGATAANPASGVFNRATNWDTGQVPGRTDDAVFGAGSYRVTISWGSIATVGTVAIEAGVTLGATGGPLYATSGTNAGTIDAENNSGVYSQGMINAAGGRIITSTVANISMTLDNNLGLIEAKAGGVLTFYDCDPFEGQVTSGHWMAMGAGSTITFFAQPVTTIGSSAVLTLTGAGSVINANYYDTDINVHGYTYMPIEQSLTTIAAGGQLQVLGNRDFAASNTLTVDGTLQLGGGTLSGGNLDGSGTLTGFGTITSDFTGANASPSGVTVRALAGTLTLTGDNVLSGALTGAGTLEFAAGTDRFESGATLTAKTVHLTGATITLDEALTDNYAFGLQSGAVDLNGNVLTLQGATTLSGGTVDGSGASLLRFIGANHSVTSSGTTTIAPNVLNNGSIAITGGALILEGNLSGTGGVAFSATGSASLELGGTTAGGQTIDLNGNSAVSLIVDRASTFKGSLANLAAGDTIDLTNIASKSTTLIFDKVANALDVTRGGRTVAALKLAGGSYDASQFSLSADTHAGSLLTFHGVSA